MQILWCSNYTSHSGYANQAKLFIPEIVNLGHQVTVFELGTSCAGIIEQNGITILPTSYTDRLGNDTILRYTQQIRPDAVITLIDAWGLNPAVWGQTNWFQ